MNRLQWYVTTQRVRPSAGTSADIDGYADVQFVTTQLSILPPLVLHLFRLYLGIPKIKRTALMIEQ